MSTPISINSDAMQAIVHKAILEGIDDQQRDTLVAQAIQFLITAPDTQRYGIGGHKAPSPLQDAFNVAVADAARGIVRELVDSGGLGDQIRARANDAIAAAMAQDGTLADGIGDAIGRVVSDHLAGRS